MLFPFHDVTTLSKNSLTLFLIICYFTYTFCFDSLWWFSIHSITHAFYSLSHTHSLTHTHTHVTTFQTTFSDWKFFDGEKNQICSRLSQLISKMFTHRKGVHWPRSCSKKYIFSLTEKCCAMLLTKERKKEEAILLLGSLTLYSEMNWRRESGTVREKNVRKRETEERERALPGLIYSRPHRAR